MYFLSNIKKAECAFQQKYGRTPENKEIAAILSIDEKKIKEAKSWEKDATSLDIVVGDDEDVTVGSFIEDTTVKETFASIEAND